MGTGVATADRAIEAAPDDLAVLYQHRAYRHLAEDRALGSQCQGLEHEVAVAAAIDNHRLAHQTTSIAAIKPVSM
jgi:hypothetical protein